MNTYLLVGAGGTASYLMPGLIRYLDTTHPDDYLLTVCDGDTVEPTNIARQVHDNGHVGLNKATALVTRHATDIQRTQAVPAYVSDDNIADLITDGTTVLITVDNHPARARIERHAATLKNVRVINAGNEEHTGSIQLWVREDDADITPPLGFMHPEISEPGPDRALMSCAQVAKLPGGGQTTLANMLSAAHLLAALNRIEYAPSVGPLDWHELQWDSLKGTVELLDWRISRTWQEQHPAKDPVQ